MAGGREVCTARAQFAPLSLPLPLSLSASYLCSQLSRMPASATSSARQMPHVKAEAVAAEGGRCGVRRGDDGDAAPQ